MKDENIRKEWEEFNEEYAEYILSGNESWRFKLEKVKKFIDKNNRRQSSLSKNDKEERTLGKWILNQNDNYKNNSYIMKDENIRKEWEEFKEEYNTYFI